MKTKIDTDIRDKYNYGFNRSDLDVTHLVVHCTAGGHSADDCIKWMLGGGNLGGGKNRIKQYQKGIALFHYLIDLNGSAIEIINPHNYVYHSSTRGFDRHTIGVELINPDRNNGAQVTDYQYKALSQLYSFLSGVFPNMRHIKGHGRLKNDMGGAYKVCPGPGFDWRQFHFKLGDLKITNVLYNEYIEVM